MDPSARADRAGGGRRPGDLKNRSPFPQLQAAPTAAENADLQNLEPGTRGVRAIHTCSVCGRLFDAVDLRQVWISRHVSGHDILPLLVNACSAACVEALPEPAAGYVQRAHTGGPSVVQPSANEAL